MGILLYYLKLGGIYLPSDPIGSQLLAVFFLVILCYLVNAAESALLSLNESDLEELKDHGDKRAERLYRALNRRLRVSDRARTAVSMLILLAGSFSGLWFVSRMNAFLDAQTPLSGWLCLTLSFLAVTIVLALAVLLVGVQLPRRAARKNPLQTADRLYVPWRLITGFFLPITWLVVVLRNGLLKLFRLDPEETEAVTEEEIRQMVDMGEEKGVIESNEKEMIENIFEFNNMTARDVMIHRTDVVALSLEDSGEEIVRTIEETGLSRFPIYEEDIDDVIGILSTRDYLLAARRGPVTSIRELLRPAYFVPSSVRTDVLFRDMQSKKVHLSIVVDEYGGTSGIVTMEDLLEEIVGNIYDEFDPQDEQEILQLEENLWRVAGGVDLETLMEALDLPEPQEDWEYDTLGGLVFSQLNEIPEDGSQPEMEILGLRIHVEKIEDHRVEWALVSKVETPEPEDPGEEEK